MGRGDREIIGYEKARNLMVQLDWKMSVDIDKYNRITRVELYHPNQEKTYTVRRDSAKRLIPECRVCSRGDVDSIAIMGYDHDGTNDNLI